MASRARKAGKERDGHARGDIGRKGRVVVGGFKRAVVISVVAAVGSVVVAASPALAQVSFSGPTNFGACDGPASVAVGDFNGDSDPDLAVANQGSDNVSVLLNEPGPTVSVNDVIIPEGDSSTTNATFTVSLSEELTQSVEVDYAIQEGTATAGSDYNSQSGTVTFVPGDTFQTISVPVNGDTQDENDETFSVELSNPINVTISDGQGTATILDDDGCTIRGTNGDDVLAGTGGKDVICGLGGDDRIDARDRADVIEGGDGDDKLIGGAGRDLIEGGDGEDVLKARDGRRDIVYGQADADTCVVDKADIQRSC